MNRSLFICSLPLANQPGKLSQPSSTLGCNGGDFSNAVIALTEELTRLRVHVEAAIDFPEEEIDFLSDEELRKKADACAQAFTSLQKEATVGRLLRDGYQVIIIGPPNAGKSSLLNLLSGQDTAIVTEIAGTTRDILREQIEIDGLAVELIDTAFARDIVRGPVQTDSGVGRNTTRTNLEPEVDDELLDELASDQDGDGMDTVFGRLA